MSNVENNTKHFKKVVREFNKKTGLEFVLPKDTNYSERYAHPVCDNGKFRLRGQIDPDSSYIYGIEITYNKFTFRADIADGNWIERLERIVESEAFKIRKKQLDILARLAKDLDGHRRLLRGNIADYAITEIEKEETYDLITRTARKLYKS